MLVEIRTRGIKFDAEDVYRCATVGIVVCTYVFKISTNSTVLRPRRHVTAAPDSSLTPGTRSALTGRRLAALFPAGRDAVKARDALLGQCPLGQPRGVRRRGYSPTDTAHEMRIPLRPLRMSKSYRRLRKRTLRSESVKALLEMSVPTVSPSSET